MIDKPQLFGDYDLLGFDPRGFGASTPLECVTTVERLQQLPTTPDHRIRDEATHAAEVANAMLFADACNATEFGGFVSSTSIRSRSSAVATRSCSRGSPSSTSPAHRGC